MRDIAVEKQLVLDIEAFYKSNNIDIYRSYGGGRRRRRRSTKRRTASRKQQKRRRGSRRAH